MRDPRIDELLTNLDEKDSLGIPTRFALMAAEVQGYVIEIAKLRAEVEIANRQVVYLTGRESSLNQSLERQSESKRATAAGGNDAGGAVVAAPDRASEDEPEFAFQKERLETVVSNLRARRHFVKRTQDLIASRVNTVQQVLDQFKKLEAAEASASQPRRPLTSLRGRRVLRNRRGRRVRLIRRIRRIRR